MLQDEKKEWSNGLESGKRETNPNENIQDGITIKENQEVRQEKELK